jgi:hypothetical protein
MLLKVQQNAAPAGPYCMATRHFPSKLTILACRCSHHGVDRLHGMKAINTPMHCSLLHPLLAAEITACVHSQQLYTELKCFLAMNTTQPAAPLHSQLM